MGAVALSLNDIVGTIEEAEMTFNDICDQAGEVSTNAMTSTVSKIESLMIGTMIISAILVFLVIVIVMVSVVRPVQGASRQLEVIVDNIEKQQGDLTERILVKTQDEVGYLVGGVNSFIEKLQKIMQTIREDSNRMTDSTGQIYERMSESNENVTSISAVMEELAASMKDISGTAEQIDQSVRNVYTETQSMASGAKDGAGKFKAI